MTRLNHISGRFAVPLMPQAAGISSARVRSCTWSVCSADPVANCGSHRNGLREAGAVDQVAEWLALDCRIATEAPDVAATLLWRVKAAVDRLGKRGLLAVSGRI